ncbi:hypothetical protein SAMN05444422_108101 [Halobiforma haloterrestris]|uniref:Uncharacterized protein n=1 Tax=Natronobacterium haloterrestre TaxID=148448 RepID=A0A1I1J2M3_NATHA|nr:hypothetical protein [Halobiforma haloterrestris]SFC42764.1 hypothetical protein SAMN05444422_108101 [Halobiforma haloterrestris]
MTTDSHPPRDSADWDNPDCCPFCGATLPDGGGGFMDHVDETSVCNERFRDWLERVREDMEGEWGG